MNTGRFQPQMTQMNADVFLKIFICANLRNLRLNKALRACPPKPRRRRKILEKIDTCRLKSGDIVFARIGATTGKSYMISDPPDAELFEDLGI